MHAPNSLERDSSTCTGPTRTSLCARNRSRNPGPRTSESLAVKVSASPKRQGQSTAPSAASAPNEGAGARPLPKVAAVEPELLAAPEAVPAAAPTN